MLDSPARPTAAPRVLAPSPAPAPLRPSRADARTAVTAPEGGATDRLTTFDCFDTVITRAVGDPESVAYVTGLRLVRDGVVTVSAERYAAARTEAEKLVARSLGDAHTTVDIAVQVAELLNLPADRAEVLHRTEALVEHELTREVPGARARIEAARASGRAVGFLSDTPQPHDVVESLLRTHGLLHDGDHLWVSNELGAGKARGAAYPAVARRLGTPPRRWTHLGDDARADVRNARLCGVDAHHLTAGRLNRYERVLERHGRSSGGLASVMAGSSRRTRLLMATEHPGVPTGLVDVAAGAAGPLLAGYVLWCLQQAQAAGCRRLYFVARGGEVLVDMARRLAEHLDLDVEVEYLLGSRKAWMLPTTAADRRDFLLSVAGREDRVTVRSTLTWLSVPPEALAGPLATAGFPSGTWDASLDRPGLERLAGVVQDPAADAVLAAQASRRSVAAGDFLRGAGLLDGVRFAVVDMTGRGTTGRFLTETLRRCGGGAPALELYLGLERETHDVGDRTLRAYLFDDRRGVGIARRDADLWVPLEAFTQARHGHVSHYEERDGQVAPVLSFEVNEPLLAWGLEGFRTALDVFCRELGPALRHVDPWGDVRRSTWEALRTFWLTPTPREVAAWRDFPLEDDVATYPMGRGYTARQVLGTVLAGRPRLRPRGTWPAAVERSLPAGLRLARAGARRTSGTVAKARRLAGFVGHRREVRARG